MASFSTEEQQAYVKIEFYRGTVAVNIFKTQQKLCGGQALLCTAVYRWIDLLNNGRDSVKSRYSPGRPVEATDKENVRKMKQVLDTDRQLTCDALAYNLGISHGLIYTLMRDKLNMGRVTACWVSHCLSEDQKKRASLWHKHY